MTKDHRLKQERDYLYQDSKQFTQAYPQLSHFLSEPSFDPDINRTLDGLTYLTALLNTKLEQAYPQLTASLMNILWPNYLQQTPSLTILAFNNQHDHTTLITAGSTVQSQPASAGETSCTFSVCRDTWVSPFNITKVTQRDGDELAIHFHAHHPVNLCPDELDKLRLYCGSDAHAGSQLYLWFSQYLSQAMLMIDENTFALPALRFQPVGFDNEEAMLVYPGNTFNGYRLLHEYFCFPEGFLFFDIQGIPDYFSQITTRDLTLTLKFSQALPATVKIAPDLIKSNCVPAINLFEYDCEPILLDGRKTTYPLTIDFQHQDCYELFAIDQVTGWLNQQSRHYALFDSFHHQLEQNKQQHPFYYHLHQQPTLNSDKIQYSIAFVRGDETLINHQQEVISIRARCSNNDIAQHLRIGDICRTDDSIPNYIQVRNVTYPSRAIRPNLNASQQWSTISSLSLNYLSLLNKTSLCQILKNYNFTTRYSARAEKGLEKLLQGIVQFDAVPAQYTFTDAVIGGYESTLRISPDAFNSEGEMYLFGAIIAHFYAGYAAVNSFHFLNLVNASTHEVYQWQLINH
ncbi:type VI secretion system baseplate subunit TssF [Utexia brackfieldae]|uniref:type VI secretion system baseplate subunit TssF n=1 Tax=Utexia brackfieldae TaxID=3074108 RepID=UPI00370D90E5